MNDDKSKGSLGIKDLPEVTANVLRYDLRVGTYFYVNFAVSADLSLRPQAGSPPPRFCIFLC